jgi:hypothetical protein
MGERVSTIRRMLAASGLAYRSTTDKNVGDWNRVYQDCLDSWPEARRYS